MKKPIVFANGGSTWGLITGGVTGGSGSGVAPLFFLQHIKGSSMMPVNRYRK